MGARCSKFSACWLPSHLKHSAVKSPDQGQIRRYTTEEEASFYMRTLNPPAIASESAQGHRLLLEAIRDGTAMKVLNLFGNFGEQSHPSYCGPASLRCVLNGMKLDPKRVWKSPWRWFNDEMIADESTMEQIRKEGIDFDTFAKLAHGFVDVDAYRASETPLENFIAHLTETNSSVQSYMIASYARATVNQTGGGHYSPVAAYHTGEDMALILDVASFKYPHHWLPGKLLWEAMSQLDTTTQKTRGFFVLRKRSTESATETT